MCLVYDILCWFSAGKQIFSFAYYFYHIRIALYGGQPVTVQIVVTRPYDNTVFYTGIKI